MASVWGQVWRQIWSGDISIAGRLFRLLMIVWNVPIMLLGLIFDVDRNQESQKERQEDEKG